MIWLSSKLKNLKKYDAGCFLSTAANVFSLPKKALENMSDTEKEAAAKVDAKDGGVQSPGAYPCL